MAVVNIDLSEYDAVRSRVKELEAQVKELKKTNKALKTNAKVILRKETQVEINETTFERFDDRYGVHYEAKPKYRKTLETSESYINFEDVRLKVENEMREEVERSIKQNKEACERYANAREEYKRKYDNLEVEFEKKTKDMEETCRETLKKKNDEFRDEYRELVTKLERKGSLLMLRLNEINRLADDATHVINTKWFCGEETKNILWQIKSKTVVHRSDYAQE